LTGKPGDQQVVARSLTCKRGGNVDDRQELLLAWLEGEGERQGRPIPLLSTDMNPTPRALVHLFVCLFAGTMTVAILACWLMRARDNAAGTTVANQLLQLALRIHVQVQVGNLRVGDLRGDDPNPWSILEQKEKGTVRRNAPEDIEKFVVGKLEQKEKVPVRSNGDDSWLLPFFLGGAIAFKTLIGALLLGAGCDLYNSLLKVGSPLRVPELVFGKALAIAFTGAMLDLILGAGIVSGLVGFLVLAKLISVFLPTTFARGLLVSLCYSLVAIVAVVVFVIIVGYPLPVPAHLRR
jgi:hypothetical protein